MSLSPLPLKTADNARGQLNAGIGASDLTIVLQSGEGANFPQPYTGSATSAGSSTTLNCTGIGSSGIAQYDLIRNVTDGSWALVLTVATDSITTTRLRDGSGNTWDNSDVWRVNEFVITLADVTTNTYGVSTVNSREQVLVSNRSTDTLTVPSGGRGYNGTVAAAFDAEDYVYLNVTSVTIEEIKEMIASNTKQINTNETDIDTAETDIVNLEKSAAYRLSSVAGTNTITADSSPAITSYEDGMRFNLVLANTVTGAATLNIESLGAKKIVKFTNGTEEDLTNADLVQDQTIDLIYDTAADSASGAFVLVSPLGRTAQSELESEQVIVSTGSGVGPSSTSEFDLNTGFAIDGSAAVAGDCYLVKAVAEAKLQSGDTLTYRIKVGTTAVAALVRTQIATSSHTSDLIQGFITIRTTGASASVYGCGTLNVVVTGAQDEDATAGGHTIDLTADPAIKISAQYDTSDSGNEARIAQFIVIKVNSPS